MKFNKKPSVLRKTTGKFSKNQGQLKSNLGKNPGILGTTTVKFRRKNQNIKGNYREI